MIRDETVVLVQGYNKGQSDMATLKTYLSGLGYNCVSFNLPTTFGTLEECTRALEIEFSKVQTYQTEQRKIHFVGHSMGGLIIRSYLARNLVTNLGRCVLIATPNKGSRLADIVFVTIPVLTKIYKPLRDLRTLDKEYLKNESLQEPEIGVIAGNKNNLLLGRFLRGENDGRVEVDSTKIHAMKDFTITRYGHKEIHHKHEVAVIVDKFLQSGHFQYGSEHL